MSSTLLKKPLPLPLTGGKVRVELSAEIDAMNDDAISVVLVRNFGGPLPFVKLWTSQDEVLMDVEAVRIMITALQMSLPILEASS